MKVKIDSCISTDKEFYGTIFPESDKEFYGTIFPESDKEVEKLRDLIILNETVKIAELTDSQEGGREMNKKEEFNKNIREIKNQIDGLTNLMEKQRAEYERRIWKLKNQITSWARLYCKEIGILIEKDPLDEIFVDKNKSSEIAELTENSKTEKGVGNK